MVKYPCELIKDLLPLYADDDVDPKTREILDEHLRECPNCQELYKELKNAGPVPPELKESLPEANTFKRSLKRLKLRIWAGLILILFAGIVIGFAAYKTESSVPKDILSLNDVIRTLKKAGLTLTPDSSLNPGDYKIGNQTPGIYKLSGDENLYIYCFSSIGERDTKFRQWQERNKELSSNLWNDQQHFGRQYAAKNTIIVYTKNNFSALTANTDLKNMTSTLTVLGKTIFYDLNKGQQIIFQGEGDHWKEKLTLNYYQHFWTDNKGIMHSDTWNNKWPLLVFKNDVKTINGNFSYKFESSAGDFVVSNDDGFCLEQFSSEEGPSTYGGAPAGSLGFGGSNGAIPQKDDSYTVTVKWNDQRETFALKTNSP